MGQGWPVSGVFRDGLLNGQHAFLTGGTSGIGLAIARRLAQAGAKVSLVGRNEEKLAAAVAELQTSGNSAQGFAADVRHYDVLARALSQACVAFGEIDILICAAAGNFPAPALGMSANGFKAVIDIDVLGTFNTCRAAHEHLRKPGASILNISAAHAFRPLRNQAHVCAAKAGVDMLTKTLALEWGPQGIRINSVTPGPIEDTEGMRRLAPDDETRRGYLTRIPLQRFGRKNDVADLCLFLCTPAASFIHGAVVLCDGGESIS
jgi:NAD(P)-dependent dehydrogenase (short-subunit alcohol dehydrogenase family)